MNIAVITGASSGLGKVFFQKMMERYTNLDEIWLIARREDRLKELANKYPDKKVRILPLDLSDTKSIETLDDVLREQRPNIKVLINNAGFDRAGLFGEMKYEDIHSIINVNVMGMTMISRTCLQYMSNGSYEIITGSIGSFVPLPWRAVYSASKAYVRFFARALHDEERKRGVNIMLLSPGSMNTEMFRENTTGGKLSIFPYLNLEKETVKAMKKAERGAAVYTPRAFYKAYRVFAKIVPSALAVKFTSVESSVPKE
ncbi:SDR family NAD(P)-dependent oxidoreductase [Clostridium cellulovorans]|uniref:Short-chain dehydrogenase/reductase SDR n=1 Tax=Clostridium cellulovorans (strain ATCC 35296 / DSM 3052 / OCM 3 / 743B) TaxID=573061 RepID=D9SQA9_CLOC7|nr:SDR family NAD(P)-dependent oxidoreductase [Clostridium cellulovorans]ADL50176.1 short-chain dehydrogenase/reductase SDR [Clostridium cellulovorans 743B]